MTRRPRLLALAIAGATVVGGCSNDLSAGGPVQSARGAVTAGAPEGWNVERTFRRLDPLGEGFDVYDEAGSYRMTVFASSSALREELGDDPTRRELFTFSHLVDVASRLDAFPIGTGCSQTSVRPIEGGGYYGEASVKHCSKGLEAEVRATLVSARRTSVVWVTVAAERPSEALELASLAVDGLVIDRNALPANVGLPESVRN